MPLRCSPKPSIGRMQSYIEAEELWFIPEMIIYDLIGFLFIFNIKNIVPQLLVRLPYWNWIIILESLKGLLISSRLANRRESLLWPTLLVHHYGVIVGHFFFRFPPWRNSSRVRVLCIPGADGYDLAHHRTGLWLTHILHVVVISTCMQLAEWVPIR